MPRYPLHASPPFIQLQLFLSFVLPVCQPLGVLSTMPLCNECCYLEGRLSNRRYLRSITFQDGSSSPRDRCSCQGSRGQQEFFRMVRRSAKRKASGASSDSWVPLNTRLKPSHHHRRRLLYSKHNLISHYAKVYCIYDNQLTPSAFSVCQPLRDAAFQPWCLFWLCDC